MGYVAIQGGQEAIAGASDLLEALRTQAAQAGEHPLDVQVIAHQLHYLQGAVLSEGGIYDPQLAALAIKQTLGDPLEAAFLLRAYRSTRSRLDQAGPFATETLRCLRRISAAFKDVPGGQMLGPTPDYTHRLFRLELLEENDESFQAACRETLNRVLSQSSLHDAITRNGKAGLSFPKVVQQLRREGLVAEPRARTVEPFDITREPIRYPLPRSARLAMLSRSQTGSALAMAYTSMRGYGSVHPTIAELRVGYLPVLRPHPITGNPTEIGEVMMTECEVISGQQTIDQPGAKPVFGLGYGACFGHNETKAIAMAILDRCLIQGERKGVAHPAEDQEFVLAHLDGVESMGFCVHYKMPHYVTFLSDLDRLCASRDHAHRESVGTDYPSESQTEPIIEPSLS